MTAVPFFDLGTAVRAVGEQVHAAVERTIQGGYFVGGPLVADFEAEFAAYLGARHCVAVGNGLDALRLSLEARSIGAGDEVIVPAFTFYATILAIMQTGATPVFADVDITTANLDATKLDDLVTPRTRAIMPVHLYGRAADLAALMAVAERHGLDVFEDAAQSHGAMSSAGMTGTVGTTGSFSFYPTKNLGALGDGGAIVTANDEIADRVRSRRSYGQGATKYEHVDTGWNSRLDPMQAAILSSQLGRLDAGNAYRRQIASRYFDALGPRSTSALGPRNVADSVWHHFVLRAADRDGLRSFLASNEVSTDIHYPYAAYALEPVLERLPAAARTLTFEAADTLAAQVTSLPMGPWMSDEQVDIVADALSRIPHGLLVDA